MYVPWHNRKLYFFCSDLTNTSSTPLPPPLLQVFPVTFLTCPAVNKGHADRTKHPERLPRGETAESTMRRRVENVLRVAAEHGLPAIVLGAWGCGVFKNDPAVVAGLFRDQLVGPDAPFANVFRKVVFAMGKSKGDKNAEEFQRVIIGV